MSTLPLHDQITIVSTKVGGDRPDDMTVPAHVYAVSGTSPRDQNRPGILVTELRAMTGPLPRPIDAPNDDVQHHGDTYRIDGPPLGRYRRGRLHHWTITLERVTG